MSNFIIDGIDFENLAAEKYWTFAKSYKGDKKKETKQMFLSGDYYASLKNDGHYFRFIKDMNGNMRLQGRTESVNGGYLNKYDWVPQCHSFFESLPNGTCLIGEIYFPNNRGSRNVTTIMGCLVDKALSRQNKGEKLHYYIFECYAWNGKSLLKNPYRERVECIRNNIQPYTEKSDYVEVAQFYDGEEAWNKYGEILAAGLEGMVLYRKNGLVEPNKRTARKSLKCKLEIEEKIDAFIDGEYKEPTREYTGKTPLEEWQYWLNLKTGEKFTVNKFIEYTKGEPIIPITRLYALGYAGAISFSVMKEGKPVRIGWISGVPDTMRAAIVQNPESVVGKVYSLTAMEIEPCGDFYSLRHGKIDCERSDKRPEDCEWSQIADK